MTKVRKKFRIGIGGIRATLGLINTRIRSIVLGVMTNYAYYKALLSEKCLYRYELIFVLTGQ